MDPALSHEPNSTAPDLAQAPVISHLDYCNALVTASFGLLNLRCNFVVLWSFYSVIHFMKLLIYQSDEAFKSLNPP
ncbi:unnamed protein product [Arctogadus glacialis]